MKLLVVVAVAQPAMPGQTVPTRQAVLELHYWDFLWAEVAEVAPNTDRVAVCRDQVEAAVMLMYLHPQVMAVAVAVATE
jgi:hypothetical protein